jgi:hypothetical protein
LLGREVLPIVVSDPSRQLQRQTVDRLFTRSEEAHARAEGDSNLGWLACALEREAEAVSESQRSWLQVETLQGYSPNLNPVEDLWSNIKGQEFANRCAAGMGEAENGVSSGMERVRQSKLRFSFLHHAGLSF